MSYETVAAESEPLLGDVPSYGIASASAGSVDDATEMTPVTDSQLQVWITWIFTEVSDANYFSAPGLQWISGHRRSWYTGGSPRATRATFFSSTMYLMKHLISTICSSHRNYHRTSSIDWDLHKLMKTILCELRNLTNLLPLSPLIIINNILSGVLSITAFYLTFYVAFLLHCVVLYSVTKYRGASGSLASVGSL